MSVVVLGMGMPDNCHMCGMCFGGLCYAMPPDVDEMCPDHDRPDWCPLRPLPEKHGRLIDGDALPRYTGYALSADEVATAVENAPTIIETEGENDG